MIWWVTAAGYLFRRGRVRTWPTCYILGNQAGCIKDAWKLHLNWGMWRRCEFRMTVLIPPVQQVQILYPAHCPCITQDQAYINNFKKFQPWALQTSVPFLSPRRPPFRFAVTYFRILTCLGSNQIYIFKLTYPSVQIYFSLPFAHVAEIPRCSGYTSQTSCCVLTPYTVSWPRKSWIRLSLKEPD